MATVPAAEFWWAVPMVGCIAALVAMLSLRTTRMLARARATLDLIEGSESSRHYADLRASFRRLERDADGTVLQALMTPHEAADHKLRRDIYAYLNHYELVAIGCTTGILDEAFYASWMRTQLVRDWFTAAELVALGRRENANPAEYAAFEQLAWRFAHDDIGNARLRRTLSAPYRACRAAAIWFVSIPPSS